MRLFFFSSRRRHTRWPRDWSSDVCSSDLSKIKVKPDGTGIVTEGMKYKINPFDEIAVEEGLRLIAKHSGELVVASAGGKEVQEQLRHALAMGASKAVWINHAGPLDQMAIAALLQKVVEKEK